MAAIEASSSVGSLGDGSSNNSLMSPLMKPESVLGMGGSTGLDGQAGVDLADWDPTSRGGEDVMSGGVSAGLSSFSGDVMADSMDGWSSVCDW